MFYVIDARADETIGNGAQGPFRTMKIAADYADSLNRFVVRNSSLAFILHNPKNKIEGPFYARTQEVLHAAQIHEINRLGNV